MADSGKWPVPLGALAWVLLTAGVILVPILGSWYVEPSGAETHYSLLGLASSLLPEILTVLALGLAAAWVGTGTSGVFGALRCVLGAGPPSETALRGLTVWARTTTAAGFVVGVVGFLGLIFLTQAAFRVDDLPGPAALAGRVTTTIVGPLAGVLFGRVVLGSTAEAVRGRLGRSKPAFSAATDLGLLALLVPPTLVFVFVFSPWNA